MSCLFQSLGRLLEIPADTTRQMICDYLMSNQAIIDGLPTHEVLAIEGPDYVQHMRRSQTWGGAIEIQAAVNRWNVRIIVENQREPHNPPQHWEFLPLTGKPTMTLRISWSGEHYEPISRELLIH